MKEILEKIIGNGKGEIVDYIRQIQCKIDRLNNGTARRYDLYQMRTKLENCGRIILSDEDISKAKIKVEVAITKYEQEEMERLEIISYLEKAIRELSLMIMISKL